MIIKIAMPDKFIEMHPFITQHAANGNPSEGILRDYTFNTTRRNNYLYDAQNRCTRIELRDSINPTTYTLRTTYDFAYTTNKVTRTVNNPATGLTTRIEYFYDANGNITKDEVYNGAGIFSIEGTYGNYDDKKNPYEATFEFWTLSPKSKNNFVQQGVRNVVSGATSSFTATHTYNADGYPTKTVYNNGATYEYTYEKR
jgi:hypothetical protein